MFKAGILAGVLMAGSAQAQDAITYEFEGSFDDASFALENTIVGRGLGVDYVAHPGAMLKRTAADVGSDVVLFDAANAYHFCSSELSREVMEIEPMNIAFCPWRIFITDQEGRVEIGYRTFPEGEMQRVQAFLDSIVKEALEF